MIGLSVHADVAEEVAVLLDENKMSLNGKKASAIRDRFDRAIFPLKNDIDLITTRLLISDIEGADPVIVDADIVSQTIKAAERKKPAYTAKAANVARQRFDQIFGRVIVRPRRRGAHKGWVTRLEWNELERLGLWTIDWRLEYVFDGHVHVMDGRAVHEQRAIRDILKSAKMLAKSHRAARIRTAQFVITKSNSKTDLIKRASRAFDRSVG